jgi:hypothetical protein
LATDEQAYPGPTAALEGGDYRNIYMQTIDPETWRAVVNLEELVEPKKGKPKSK